MEMGGAKVVLGCRMKVRHLLYQGVVSAVWHVIESSGSHLLLGLPSAGRLVRRGDAKSHIMYKDTSKTMAWASSSEAHRHT